MRKIICFFVVIILLIQSSAISEDAASFSFTLMDNGDDICFETSLIPDTKTVIPLPDGIDADCLFNLIKPDTLPGMVRVFRETAADWSKEKAKSQTGTYSGDLFESASERTEIILEPEDTKLFFEDLIRHIPAADKPADVEVPDENTVKSAESISRFIADYISESGTSILISTYDTCYITIEMINQQETIMTISTDLSENNAFRAVIAKGSGNAAYYEEITCQESDAETETAFSLFRTKASSFRMVNEQDCLQYAEIRFKDREESSCYFEGEIHSVLLPSPARITGTRSHDETGQDKVHAELSIDGQEQGLTEILTTVLNSLTAR